MTVFVITKTLWGEGNEWTSVDCVYGNEDAAKTYCTDMNTARIVRYGAEYGYEEVEMK